MTQPPASTQPQTRQKSAAATASKTQKDPKDPKDAEGINTDVRSKEQALVFLHARDYLIPGKPVDLLTLSNILFQFSFATTKMPKPLIDGIRAVAYLIADATAQHIADEVTTVVKTHLQEQMESFNANVETLRDAVEHVTGAAKEITDKMNEFKDEFQETSEKLAQTSQDLTDKTQEATMQDHTTRDPRPTSYAAITQQHVPMAHLTVITRGETNDKQILIQKDANANSNALDSLTEKDLVTKANTALDLMGIEAADQPKDTKFVGAKKLRNGNVLYQLDTAEAAKWLRQPEVQKAFIERYGGTSNIQNKLFYTVAEFVPTTFDAGSNYAHLRVEQDNAIPTSAMAYSKYIKPQHLRASNQKVAHVILGFNDRKAANRAIKYGLFIEGKQVAVRKLLSEPKRCLKCQKFGHYVADCKAETDKCARCSGKHRTTQCTATDPGTPECANCTDNPKGHGAADRTCPTYLKEKCKLHERIPENKYKYFPTNDPRTWQLLNQPENYANDQEFAWQQGANWATTARNTQADEAFTNEWRTIRRRGRQPTADEQNRARERYEGNVNRERFEEYRQKQARDSGWPTQPIQTSIDNYFGTARSYDVADNNNQPQEQERQQGPSRWSDQDPNDQNIGPVTQSSSTTPLSYV